MIWFQHFVCWWTHFSPCSWCTKVFLFDFFKVLLVIWKKNVKSKLIFAKPCMPTLDFLNVTSFCWWRLGMHTKDSIDETPCCLVTFDHNWTSKFLMSCGRNTLHHYFFFEQRWCTTATTNSKYLNIVARKQTLVFQWTNSQF